jgi:exodeoxyribonuclease VII small subunit
MTKAMPFEKSIAELDKIVKQLEKGELSLDESLKQYEKAMVLARKCQQVLNEAETRVQMLSTSTAEGGSEL